MDFLVKPTTVDLAASCCTPLFFEVWCVERYNRLRLLV
jgi:hypothetical protein